jgi:CRP/FNR family transcriptional regulator, dissimilatory nitrate respiration regulator
MTIKNYIHILKKTALFREFDIEHIANILNGSDYSIKQHGKEDMIFMEGEMCKTLSIVLEGAVEIQKIDPSGKVLTVAKFGVGDTFGENLIFGNKNLYPMTVVSKAKSQVLHIPKETVVKLCQSNSVFLNEFLRVLSNRAVNLSAKLKEVTLKTIRQKICEFLFEKYKSTGKPVIELDMSKKEWADKIGVQRPSLSRELIKMKDEELIDYDKDTIVIKDIDSIEMSM